MDTTGSTLLRFAVLLGLLAHLDAFSLSPSSAFVRTRSSLSPVSPLHATSEETDNEIERLRSMAAKLRAEAATLESEQQQAVAQAAEKAFEKFDLNKDGEISLEELKTGLEKTFKIELSEKRVKQLMDDFDKNSDGKLQPNEFVPVEVMRNRLDSLARDEKAQALEKAKTAQMEAEAVKVLEAQLEAINEKAPSGSDKILACLPYLFPLLDGLQYAKFMLLPNLDNPLAAIVAAIYGLYRAVPFGGFIAFFALIFLSGNLSINRLIRYNMMQAIYFDIALFFPGLVAGLISLVSPGAVPPGIAALGDSALFFVLLAGVGYAVVSNLLGQEPNKVPIISQAVTDRMPSVDSINEIRFISREDLEKKDGNDQKKD